MSSDIDMEKLPKPKEVLRVSIMICKSLNFYSLSNELVGFVSFHVQYIRDCIGQNTVPELTLVPRDALFKMLPDNSCVAVRAGKYQFIITVNERIQKLGQLQRIP